MSNFADECNNFDGIDCDNFFDDDEEIDSIDPDFAEWYDIGGEG